MWKTSFFVLSGQEPWLCVRSVATRSPLSCWSASCPSSVWWEKSPRTSRLTCVSRAPPLELCRWEPHGCLSWMLSIWLSLQTWGNPKLKNCEENSTFLTLPCFSPYAGGQRGLPGGSVWRHQLVRHPRQACHHHAQRHPVGPSHPRGACLNMLSLPSPPLPLLCLLSFLP